MVMPSPAKFMCVTAGTMLDSKKAEYLCLATLSSLVQTSYNFVTMEVKAGNCNKLTRIYDSLADDYMKERRGFTMEDEVIELMSTFRINAKWSADHPEGSKTVADRGSCHPLHHISNASRHLRVGDEASCSYVRRYFDATYNSDPCPQHQAPRFQPI